LRVPKPSVKVPEPRQEVRRSSALYRVLSRTFLILVLAAIVAAAMAFYLRSEYAGPGPLAGEKVFIVEPGLSAPEIGEALARNGIVSSGKLFAVMAQLSGQRAKLKAGEYAFPAGASLRDVIALIASGKAVTYKISIPEGFTSEMAAARVNANDILVGPPAAAPPEGAILPDTYVFQRGMTRQKLLEDMQTAQKKLLDELWPKRQAVPSIATPAQAVTLASIVEKETAVAAERPLIAAVFLNRLSKGMRLQSDPTIIYGIAGGKGRLDRPLTKADITAETPYNTYRIAGLPPGPIANPGRAAIEAVLNPVATDYIYFVADGSGGHAFATTLDEHNRNVKAWRQIAGNAAASAAEAAPEDTPVQDDGAAPLASVTPEPAPPAAEAAPAAPEPGTVFSVDGRMTAIPRLRPAR
jgi:UPF0755 protein